ncbi:MAG: 2-keto-4-pentenoate hydratase [Janthinobacterium lividum]
MLMSASANRFAHQLLDLRASSGRIAPLSASAGISVEDAYDIAKNILDIRTAEGDRMVGRKIGYTERHHWPNQPSGAPVVPIWAPMYESTVRYAVDNHGIQSLQGAQQPRIEPEIVFCLGSAPGPDDTIDTIAENIEWMAHGFEIIVSPFPNWKFAAADAIAAFGMHGTLIIGEPKMLSSASRRNLSAVLATASISMSCGRKGGFSLRGAGFGSDVLESPVHALWHLHQTLQAQPQFAPLAAGEIITTGTWTEAFTVEPGQTWSTAFSGVPIPGLTVSFV